MVSPCKLSMLNSDRVKHTQDFPIGIVLTLLLLHLCYFLFLAHHSKTHFYFCCILPPVLKYPEEITPAQIKEGLEILSNINAQEKIRQIFYLVFFFPMRWDRPATNNITLGPSENII